MGVVLAQNLFRQALEAGDLSPFDAAAAYMQASSDEQRRADVWKGIRFGLAGLAIHGWTEHITEPLPEGPQPFGTDTISYRFRPDADIPLYNPIQLEDPLLTGVFMGSDALSKLRHNLERSFAQYLDSSRQIGSIAVPAVVTALTKYVKLGVDLGIARTPDLIFRGDKVYHAYRDFSVDGRGNVRYIDTPIDEAHIKSTLATAAGNTVRFSQVAIRGAMSWAMTGAESIDPTSTPAFTEDTDLGEYDQIALEKLILGVADFGVHASQRRDGTRIVIDAESSLPPELHIRASQRDGLEVDWEGKHSSPAPQHQLGQAPPKDGLVAVTRRQKCPVGYTPNAYSAMPGSKLVDATMHYLRQSGLDHPAKYMQPKYLKLSLKGFDGFADWIGDRVDGLNFFLQPRLPRFMRLTDWK